MIPFLLTLLWGLAVLAPGGFARAESPPRTEISSLDGQFLVASERLRDQNFQHCVIFMISHSRDGAFGLVVNRVFGRIGLRDLFGAEAVPEPGGRKVELHYGGPVDFERGFVLHSTDYTGKGSQMFRNGIALSADLDLVRAVAAGRGPRRSLFLAGYTGWAAGQLEQELARGDWLIAPADPELVFSPNPEGVWEQALRRAGRAL